MLDALLTVFLDFVVDTVLVKTGRGLVFVLTLGRWRGEASAKEEGRIYGAAGALLFVRNQQVVVTSTGLALIGGVGWVAAVGLIVYLFLI